MASAEKGSDLVPNLQVAQPFAGLFVAGGNEHRQQVARVRVGLTVLGKSGDTRRCRSLQLRCGTDGCGAWARTRARTRDA